MADPGFNGLPRRLGISNWTGRCVFCCITIVSDATV